MNKKCLCFTWVPVLCAKLLGLSVRRRKSDDSLVLEGPLSNYHDENLVLEGLLSDYHDDSLLLEGPLSNYHDDSLVLEGPLSDYHPVFDDETTRHVDNLLLLPNDILINILSRLSVECALQCQCVCRPLCDLIMSTPFISCMQFSRSTPVIVTQCESLCYKYEKEKDLKLYAYHIVLHFIDEGNRIVAASIPLTLYRSYVPQWPRCMPSLIGSYNGLLLFNNRFEDAFFVFNPITQAQVLLIAQVEVCGLYFHTRTSEYRVLYMSRYKFPFRFFVLSLQSKVSRSISQMAEALAPCICRSPVILNGALHWMATNTDGRNFYTCRFGTSPSCSKSILVFNMGSEDFRTMPHPGSHCCSEDDRHRTMQLLEMDGHLCLCDVALSTNEVHLWVLEDYRKQVWFKRHIINIESLQSKYFPETDDSHYARFLQALQIRNNELLLQRKSRDLFYYHLKLNIFRKVEMDCFPNGSRFFAVAHTNTLASLQTDSTVIRL